MCSFVRSFLDRDPSRVFKFLESLSPPFPTALCTNLADNLFSERQTPLHTWSLRIYNPSRLFFRLNDRTGGREREEGGWNEIFHVFRKFFAFFSRIFRVSFALDFLPNLPLFFSLESSLSRLWKFPRSRSSLFSSFSCFISRLRRVARPNRRIIRKQRVPRCFWKLRGTEAAESRSVVYSVGRNQ